MSADNFVEIRKFGSYWKWAVGLGPRTPKGIPTDDFNSAGFSTPAMAEDDARATLPVIEHGVYLIREEPEDDGCDMIRIFQECGFMLARLPHDERLRVLNALRVIYE